MFRFSITARRALYVLVLAASFWSSNAAAQACSDYPNGVLEDTPTNAPGTQFVDTAKWDFGTFEIATP